MKHFRLILIAALALTGCALFPAHAEHRRPPVLPDAREVIQATDAPTIRALLSAQADAAHWHPAWVLQKWNSEKARNAGQLLPDEMTVVHGNLLTTAGVTRLWNLFTNQGATQAFDATHCRIGAGDSSTAATAADTDLGAAAGSTHRWFQLVSAVGTVSGATCTFAATFGSADGNFAWQELGTDQGTASGNTVTAVLLNHKITSLGTKSAGASWSVQEPITVN